MIDPKLLDLLRCPVDGSALKLADDALIAKLNESIAQGELRDASDQKVAEPLEQGLATAERLYPVRGSIPTLIAEQAIPLSDGD